MYSVSVFSHYTSGMSLLSGEWCILDCTVRHPGVELPLSSLASRFVSTTTPISGLDNSCVALLLLCYYSLLIAI